MAYFIKTKIRNVFKYIRVDEEKWSECEFVIAAVAAHNMIFEEEYEVDFFDNNHASIDSDLLLPLIKQYSGCACFFIEIVIVGEQNKTITTEQLSMYLKHQEKLGPLFVEHKRLGYLKTNSRIRLVNALGQLIATEYAGNASETEIMSICRATIEIFASLQGEDAELNKIDLLYNPKRRRGFLFDKLRNMDRNKQVAAKTKRKKSANRNNSLNESLNSSEYDENELLSYFKTYVVKNGVDELKEKLLETIEMRRNLLLTNVTQIKAMFPFYFVDASLVFYDFDLMYSESNSNVLFSEKWSEIRVRPYELLKKGIERSDYSLTDVHFFDFLHLLKIFPSYRTKFEDSVQNLIKINEDRNADPVRMLDKKNRNVYILAIVAKSQDSDDVQFYIVVDGQIMNVMDLFYKVHKLFNVGYHKSLKAMMTFLGHYAFKINEPRSQLTSKIQETAAKILNDAPNQSLNE